MNIVMIGDSAVGKTTFMISTYGLLADGAIQGFRVQCKNEQTHRRLMRAYHDFRTDGMYPPATVQMNLYEYDFYSNDDWVMSFSLTDIRGESIHEYDIAELETQLRNADAVLLFLNGYDIVHGKDVSEQLDDILVLLNGCFISQDQPKLIEVLFSQIDRLDTIDEQTLQILLNTVQELQKMTDKNENIVFHVIPTACALHCMMDLDFVMMTLMLFGYSVDIVQKQQVLISEWESIQKQYGTYDPFLKKAGRTVLDLFGLDIEKNKARKKAFEKQCELQKFEHMNEIFARLDTFCKNYEMGTSYQIKQRWSSREENPFDL